MTASYIREQHETDSSVPICNYYESFDREGREGTISPGVYNIDDLKELGHKMGWCPYYLARHTVSNLLCLKF